MFVSATTKIIVLIITGICLSIGFWLGKKITNSLDYKFYMLKNGDAVKEGIIP